MTGIINQHKTRNEGLLNIYKKEVSREGMIPVQITTLKKLHIARVIPIRVVTQYAIDNIGNRKNTK